MRLKIWKWNGIDGGTLPITFSRNGALTMASVGKELLRNIFLNSRGWNDLDLVDDSISLDVSIGNVNSHIYSNCSN